MKTRSLFLSTKEDTHAFFITSATSVGFFIGVLGEYMHRKDGYADIEGKLYLKEYGNERKIVEAVGALSDWAQEQLFLEIIAELSDVNKKNLQSGDYRVWHDYDFRVRGLVYHVNDNSARTVTFLALRKTEKRFYEATFKGGMNPHFDSTIDDAFNRESIAELSSYARKLTPILVHADHAHEKSNNSDIITWRRTPRAEPFESLMYRHMDVRKQDIAKFKKIMMTSFVTNYICRSPEKFDPILVRAENLQYHKKMVSRRQMDYSDLDAEHDTHLWLKKNELEKTLYESSVKGFQSDYLFFQHVIALLPFKELEKYDNEGLHQIIAQNNGNNGGAILSNHSHTPRSLQSLQHRDRREIYNAPRTATS